ncbi:MAG: hypothetical protein PSX81_11750 [bacterium]|nr:hypothetical protein [bacterium]
MKSKHLLILLFVFCYGNIQAQIEKSLPTEAEWQSYFYAKQSSIQTKLYQLVLDGKVKAYKNDSLITPYRLEDIKKRGSIEKIITYKGKDSVIYEAMKPSDMKEFWFCKQISTSPFNEVESNKLVAIVLTFQPTFGGFKARTNPLCWLLVSDLKTVLSKEDYEWLLLVFYYVKNDNKLLFRDSEWGDAYWEANHVKLLNNISNADSVLYQKMGQSFGISSFYFESYWYDERHVTIANIYDFQQKKTITYNDFQTKYQEQLSVFMQTDVNDLTIGKDTIIYNPRVLEKISNLIVDKASHKIKTFNFEIKDSENANKILKFSMDAEFIRKTGMLPTLFWFFEDYYKWSQ